MENGNNALQLMGGKEVALKPSEWSRDQIDLIKNTVAKGTTDDELKLFLYTAKKVGLDPLLKQIHAVKRAGNMTIQTAIDGYRLIADRTGKYAGNDDYEFDDTEKRPKWAKARVWKMVEGQRCAFEATARWEQYYPGEKQGFMWAKMPHLMLGKCAEALSLRKAFPAEMAGLYTQEEMAQAAEPLEHHETRLESKVSHYCDEPKGETLMKENVKRESALVRVKKTTPHKYKSTRGDAFYYVIEDANGNSYTTFSDSHYDVCEEARIAEKDLMIEYQYMPGKGKHAGKTFKNLTHAAYPSSLDPVKDH